MDLVIAERAGGPVPLGSRRARLDCHGAGRIVRRVAGGAGDRQDRRALHTQARVHHGRARDSARYTTLNPHPGLARSRSAGPLRRHGRRITGQRTLFSAGIDPRSSVYASVRVRAGHCAHQSRRRVHRPLDGKAIASCVPCALCPQESGSADIRTLNGSNRLARPPGRSTRKNSRMACALSLT